MKAKYIKKDEKGKEAVLIAISKDQAKVFEREGFVLVEDGAKKSADNAKSKK